MTNDALLDSNYLLGVGRVGGGWETLKNSPVGPSCTKSEQLYPVDKFLSS